MFLGNTNTVIGNFNEHVIIHIIKAGGGFAIYVAVFNGVVNEVGNYLPYFFFIGKNKKWFRDVATASGEELGDL